MRWFRTENGLVARQLGREDINTTTTESGTYTPTVLASTNLSATITYSNPWLRVGDSVTVSGRIDCDPTTTGVWTARITLPIDPTDDFTGDNKLSGCGSPVRNTVYGVRILQVNATKLAELACHANDAGNLAYSYTFTYRLTW